MIRETIWFNTGTFESHYEVSSFIKSVENKQRFNIGCPEEIFWRNE